MAKDYVCYAWRHDVGNDILTSPFDPMTDEFNIYECTFHTPEDAVEFLLELIDEDEVPAEYALVEITERHVPLPAQT